MDIGAGSLEFLSSTKAKQKIAVDPIFHSYKVKQGISCYTSMKSLPKKLKNTVDVVMISNVLEHLSGRDEIMRLLLDIRALLKKNGSLLIIQPTIDLVGQRYWDFFDHIVPMTRASLLEALMIAGFSTKQYIPRFLPYSTKLFLPMPTFLLTLYLAIPWFLRPFTGQCFVRAIPKK